MIRIDIGWLFNSHFGAFLAVCYHRLPELVRRHGLQRIVHHYGFAAGVNVQSSIDSLSEIEE